MPNLIGTAPDQVPTNGDLGSLAFMDYVGIHANGNTAPDHRLGRHDPARDPGRLHLRHDDDQHDHATTDAGGWWADHSDPDRAVGNGYERQHRAGDDRRGEQGADPDLRRHDGEVVSELLTKI